MGDTANWEFAAAVAAVSIGLGGLLLFTIIGALGSWRMFDRAGKAAVEATKAHIAMQELSRSIAARDERPGPPAAVAAPGEEQRGLSALRDQADALMEQQTRLQKALRDLVDAGVSHGEDSGRQLREIDAAIRRLEEHLSQLVIAVANVTARG